MTETFGTVGSNDFEVPPNVCRIEVDAFGAEGGNGASGGAGGAGGGGGSGAGAAGATSENGRRPGDGEVRITTVPGTCPPGTAAGVTPVAATAVAAAPRFTG